MLLFFNFDIVVKYVLFDLKDYERIIEYKTNMNVRYLELNCFFDFSEFIMHCIVFHIFILV